MGWNGLMKILARVRKHTEVFTSIGELRDENRFQLGFHHGLRVVYNKKENRDTSEVQE